MSMSYLLKPSLRSQYVIHATTLQIIVTLKVLLSFFFITMFRFYMLFGHIKLLRWPCSFWLRERWVINLFVPSQGGGGWGLMSMKIITSKGIEDGPNQIRPKGERDRPKNILVASGEATWRRIPFKFLWLWFLIVDALLVFFLLLIQICRRKK